jgi:hypothetical protein
MKEAVDIFRMFGHNFMLNQNLFIQEIRTERREAKIFLAHILPVFMLETENHKTINTY